MVPRALFLTMLISTMSTAVVVAVDMADGTDQTVVLDDQAALEQFSTVYGEGSRVEVDLAARDDLSRAVIFTPDGHEVQLFWSASTAPFLFETEQRGAAGELVEDIRSILNDGIALRVFAMPDGQWTVEHSWMDHGGVMRAAWVTAESRNHAETLVGYLATAREQGLFGTYQWIGGPMPEPPPTDDVADDYDEHCYTLGQVVRQLATLHQYGGDADEFISGLVVNGVSKDEIASYRQIASDIAASPRLITEPDREYAIEYQVQFYEALCR